MKKNHKIDKKNEDNKVNVVEKDILEKEPKKKYKFYFGYSIRLCLFLFFFFFFLLVSFFSLKSSFVIEKEKNVTYQENSNLDYKVYLKKNDFYDTPYLEKNRIYVASLIDYINVDFNYQLSATENVDLDFNYDVVAKLVIRDENDENVYFEKEYPLLDGKDSVKESTFYNFDKDIKIDYEYYNALANKFKTSYGIDTVSSLIVSLNVSKVQKEGMTFSDKVISLNIPLSQKSVNIMMNYQDVEDSLDVVVDSKFDLSNYPLFFFGLLLLVLSLYCLFKIIKYLSFVKTKKNFYDKYVNKILKEYDRLIVESKTLLDFSSFNIIKLDSFEELLDVRDNLKMPIMYYNVTTHQKCYFYIRYEDSIYLLTIKEVDLEEKNNEKKL